MNKSKQNSCPACCCEDIDATLHVPDHEYNLDVIAAYHQCSECSTLYQHPMPNIETLSTYYPDTYHSFDKTTWITKFKYSIRLKSITALFPDKEFSMLDYGCGGGEFLKFAALKLPKANFIGYEISDHKEIIKYSNGRVKIIRGSLQDLLAELSKVDVITMHHVIEHIPDPFQLFQKLYLYLNPSGYIVGQTPATDSLEHSVFKKLWSGFHAPRHTVIFSTKGMKIILKRAMFRSMYVSGGFNPAGIAVSLASLFQGNNKGSIKRQGLGWFALLCMAMLFYPLDLLSGKPGIMNFKGQM